MYVQLRCGMSSDLSEGQDALRLFVAKSRERLKQLLHQLQWSQEGVRQSHHGPNATDSADQLPPSCLGATEHAVQLSAEQLQQLLGTSTAAVNTFDQLQANYSAAQKLQIYEYVIRNSPCQRISFEENAQFAELVAVTKKSQQKQRRHRKTKPTLREAMHQLLELQMQALQQQRQQELAAKERQHPPQSQLNKHREEAYRRRSPSRQLVHLQSRHSSRQHSRSRHRERSRSRPREHSRQRQRVSSHSRQRQRSSSRSEQRHSSSRKRSRSRQSRRSPSKAKRRSHSRSPRQRSRHHKRSN